MMLAIAAIAMGSAALSSNYRRNDPERSMKLWLSWLDAAIGGELAERIDRAIEIANTGTTAQQTVQDITRLLGQRRGGLWPTVQMDPHGNLCVEENRRESFVRLPVVLRSKICELDAYCRALREEQVADAAAGQIIVGGLWKRRWQRTRPEQWVHGGVWIDYAANAIIPAGSRRRYEACTVERTAPPPLQDIDETTSGANPAKPSRAELQARYDARVTPEQVPTIAEDRAWAEAQGVTQEKVQALRGNNPDPRLHTRGRRRR
jgi:hypothetical protein